MQSEERVATFHVHQIEPIGDALVPLIVTTGYTNAGGYPRGEYFLAIPDLPPYLTMRRFSANEKSFAPGGDRDLDEEFMCELALVKAKRALQQYIRSARTTDRRDLYPTHPQLSRGERDLLLSYWVEGPDDHLVQIGRRTEVDDLRDYIKWVLVLPKFEEYEPTR